MKVSEVTPPGDSGIRHSSGDVEPQSVLSSRFASMDKGLEEVLCGVDQRPTVAAYAQAAREVRSLRGKLIPVRAALLASFTIDSLVPYLEVEAARNGFSLDTYVAPFNSIQQELLDPDSGCASHQADLVFILQLLEDICPPLAQDYLGLDSAGRAQHVKSLLSEISESITAFRTRSQANIVIGNFVRSLWPPLGILEPMVPDSQTAVINQLNAGLISELRSAAGVYIFDFDKICADIGYRNWRDDKMWLLGRAPLSAALLPALAQAQATFLSASMRGPRKCLVLDLDNTLWGGVVGEEGVAGIKLGQTFPGNVYRQFQIAVLELHQRGVLLAINSKNNPADVDEVFSSHPDMVLKKHHFASIRTNWQEKSKNMVEIADELNIGMDSLVFFDDSPVERSLVKHALPAVLALEVPSDPAKFTSTLRSCRAFDRLSLTREDRQRGEMYRADAVRKELQKSAASLEDFLSSLQMTAIINMVDEFAFPRVLDLLHKTNQFNLTTRRHSATQLAAMIEDPNFDVFSLQVTDRFGDSGIVGVAIIQRKNRTAFIDSFLMSCRVIGRTIETAFLAFLVHQAKKHSLDVMVGEYIPTAKNTPAADLFKRHGFVESDSGQWRLELSAVSFTWPSYIKADLQRQCKDAQEMPEASVRL